MATTMTHSHVPQTPFPRAVASARSRQARRSTEFWGRAAEDQIAERYRQAGGHVMSRRERNAGGEIDLVIGFRDLVVFVEVKARRSMRAALGAVSPKQQERLFQAASVFLAERASALGACDARFDLAAVSGDGAVDIVENAFVGGMA